MILATLVCLPLAAVGGAPELFGYFEPQYFGFILKGEFGQMQSNKLRVDLAHHPSDRVEIGANFNFINYNGMVDYNLLDYLPADLTSSVPSENYYFSYSDTIYLDNAFVKLAFDWGDITVGRQQISYGTGYAWNPTDIFNIKDILDPAYEQTGSNALRIDLPLSNRFSCMGVYSPGQDFDSTVKMARLKGGIGHFDFTISGAFLEWEETDYFTFLKTSEKRSMAGFDMVGELLGLGTWFEGAYNFLEYSGDFAETVLGIDYTFKSGFYLMGEYYYNGLGKNDADNYDLNDWMKYISGEKHSLGKHNLFIYSDYPVSDFIRLGSSLIVSISDRSAALVPQFTYSMFQDVDLIVFGNIYGGESGGGFAEDSGTGGMARIRVYY